MIINLMMDQDTNLETSKKESKLNLKELLKRIKSRITPVDFLKNFCNILHCHELKAFYVKYLQICIKRRYSNMSRLSFSIYESLKF